MTNRTSKQSAAMGNDETNETHDNTTSKQKRCPSNKRCKFCGAQFSTVSKNTEHEGGCDARKAANVFITLDGKAKFLCKVCNQLFKYQSGLKKHELRHQAPGGFICSKCNQRFQTDSERSLHKESIHKIFKCLICEAKFKSDEEYSKHIEDVHDGKDRDYVVCTDCGAQFRQPNQLRLHNESKCGTLRCFSCEQCGSKFMTQITLNAHILIHVGEKKYLCNFCGNSYLSRGQLKVHERSHTGEKPFKCSVCGKGFAHRESLVTHSSLHTGVKPYLCENCGSRFSCIGNLIKHRRARPNSCGLPQYCKNTKCAPRASSKNSGSLTIKKIVEVKDYTKRRNITPTVNKADAIQEYKTEVMEGEVNSHSYKPHEVLLSVEDASEGADAPGEAIVYDGNGFISFEVGSVEEINEYSVQDNWQTENEVQGITTNQSEFEPNADTITFMVIKNEETRLQHPDFILPNYNGSDIQDDDTTVFPEEVDKLEQVSGDQLAVINNIEIQSKEENNCQIWANKELKRENSGCEETDEEEVSVGSFDGFGDNDDDYNPDWVDADDEPKKRKNSVQQPFIEVKENKTYHCEECPGQFMYQRSYLKHMEREHNKNATGISLYKVKNRNSNRATFVCRYCEKKYISEKLLRKHVEYHGPDGTLIHRCTCCPTYFATIKEAQEHQSDAHKDKLTCQTCNKIFKDPDCLSAHVRYVHKKKGGTTKKYTYVCTKCGKKFTSRVALGDHERANCGQSPIYKCNLCEKFYHSAGSLKTHQLIHSGNLPHLCNYCGKAFRTQGQVKVHERSHNGDKPYKCKHCPKSFGHRESLMTHISLHTGVKRFMCQGCSMRFSCISNLQAHRRSHKTTCGLLPNMTKAVGPMGNEKFSASATKSDKS